MTWAIEIDIARDVAGAEPVWKALRPSKGEPYVFTTREEAECVVRMCYPEARHANRVRVVEVSA